LETWRPGDLETCYGRVEFREARQVLCRKDGSKQRRVHHDVRSKREAFFSSKTRVRAPSSGARDMRDPTLAATSLATHLARAGIKDSHLLLALPCHRLDLRQNRPALYGPHEGLTLRRPQVRIRSDTSRSRVAKLCAISCPAVSIEMRSPIQGS
jgi:hypothetical protein